ncbi:MAG: anaerobic sulfatase maturase [Hyphomicrobiales bacterium]|nr:anaerobic sulfatase maturase [Hyphomicrobiales bacterium]
MNQIAHIMAKPVGAVCNLDCEYCYYIDRMAGYGAARSVRMPDDVLERHIRSNIAQYSGSQAREIWFSWQGGEPSLYGLSAFRRIVARQQELCPRGKTICNAFQTNGYTIDGDWARFLAEHDFLVGISIDGPPHLHDRFRHDRGGHPTHDRVVTGLRHLQAAGVRVNALTALNSDNVREPTGVYRHLKSLGIEHIQFIPVVERQKADGVIARVPQLDLPQPNDRMAGWSVDPNDYGRFLCVVFDEWSCNDIGSVFVQGFEEHLAAWTGQRASLCLFAETCGRGLALDHNGDVYSCDHYVYPQYKQGNILDSEFSEFVEDPSQVVFGQQKSEGLSAECHECNYLFACHGGCPKHRLIVDRDGGHPVNYLCPGYQMFFRHADDPFRIIVNSMRTRRPVDEIMTLLRRRAVENGERSGKIGRNDPCPCLSGLKFKRCCLHLA